MKTLKVNALYQCTAECGHCRFSCTRGKDSVAPDFDKPYEVAKALLDHRGLDYFVLLGGEPSIYADASLALLMKIHALGVPTRLETNGSWATSPERALRFLTPYQAMNTHVMLSLDGFHDVFVKEEFVFNAVSALNDLRMEYTLEIPYLDRAHRTHPIDQRTQQLEDRARETVSGKMYYVGDVLFTGRAAEQFGDVFAPGRGVPDAPCTAVPWWVDSEIETTDLLIYELGGYITKGCGIAIGNVFERDIIDIVKNYDARKHPVFSKLIEKGPLALAKEAEKYGYQIKTDYADRCHLCHEARQYLCNIYPDQLKPDQHYHASLWFNSNTD